MITGRGGDIATNASLKQRACQWISQPGSRWTLILLFAAVALGLFCMRTPVEAWLEISPFRPQNDVERRLIH